MRKEVLVFQKEKFLASLRGEGIGILNSSFFTLLKVNKCLLLCIEYVQAKFCCMGSLEDWLFKLWVIRLL